MLPGTVSSGTKLMKERQILAIAPGKTSFQMLCHCLYKKMCVFRFLYSPIKTHNKFLFAGGVREAFFSDEYYNLLWGNRVGFAKIAIEAKVVS